jgi:hypothetical protein
MPQVFGADELGLVVETSLWIEAGFLEDVEAHEASLRDAGFNQGDLPVYVDRTGFHPRGDVWGQPLTSDRAHHTWAVARVANPETDPNARQTDVGGAKPRYAVEIHKVPKNPQSRAQGSITSLWEGNDIRQFLTGRGAKAGQMTWPHVQRAMQTGPGR